MQDIHSIGGGRFFAGEGGGGGGGGDRRLRLHHHHSHIGHNQQGLQAPQALKCPRCDSLNTKFCYYNNYNLSQPRHFCKNCRRYWTKGGVLRNVPVGGGCRKAKRSKSKPPSASPSEAPARKSPNSHSSSESSSLTAATTTTEALSTPTNPLADHQPPPAPDCGMFSAGVGSFTGMMAATSGGGEAMPLEYGSISPFQPVGPAPTGLADHKLPGMAATGLLSEAVNGVGGGFGSLGDWQQCTDQGLFDLGSNVVDQAYWSQSQWTDQDPPTLYLP